MATLAYRDINDENQLWKIIYDNSDGSYSIYNKKYNAFMHHVYNGYLRCYPAVDSSSKFHINLNGESASKIIYSFDTFAKDYLNSYGDLVNYPSRSYYDIKSYDRVTLAVWPDNRIYCSRFIDGFGTYYEKSWTFNFTPVDNGYWLISSEINPGLYLTCTYTPPSDDCAWYDVGCNLRDVWNAFSSTIISIGSGAFKTFSEIASSLLPYNPLEEAIKLVDANKIVGPLTDTFKTTIENSLNNNTLLRGQSTRTIPECKRLWVHTVFITVVIIVVITILYLLV